MRTVRIRVPPPLPHKMKNKRSGSINQYICKDGRVRTAIKTENGWSVISYPRLVLEKKLGRPLEPYEDAHHIDEDPLNNDPNNLEVKIHTEHIRAHGQKYYDKIAVCFYCRKEFLWTAKQQSMHNRNLNRKGRSSVSSPFCSKSCIGKYRRQKQLNKHTT